MIVNDWPDETDDDLWSPIVRDIQLKARLSELDYQPVLQLDTMTVYRRRAQKDP